jgi:microcystin-dependent protein
MPNTLLNGLPYPAETDPADVPKDLQALADKLDSLLYIVGEVRTFALTVAPAKWVQADGRLLVKADYPALYAAIGDVWAIGGEPADQFRVPPIAGRAVVGAGQGPGLTNRGVGARFGEERHLLTVPEMPSHAHATSDPGHGHTVGSSGSTLNHSHNSVFNTLQVQGFGGGAPVFSRDAWQAAANNPSEGASINLDHGHALVNNVTSVGIVANGGGGNHENMQPSVAMLVCIYAGR